MGRGAGVVLDPRFQFGAPIVEEAGIRTEILNAAFDAQVKSGSRRQQALGEVAAFYEVEPVHVDTALRFQQWLKAA
jgi:hypothetical protein